MTEEWDREIERQEERARQKRLKQLEEIRRGHAEKMRWLNFDWTAETLVPRDPNVPARFYKVRARS